jgi:hypothetical protein
MGFLPVGPLRPLEGAWSPQRGFLEAVVHGKLKQNPRPEYL